MSERIHALAQQLFGKSSVEECDLQEIKNMANKYPYFAPAQFLLLEKLKKDNSPDYPTQLQKAVLYYHDPVAFEYFIASDKFYTEVSFEEEKPEAVVEQVAIAEPTIANEPEVNIKAEVMDAEKQVEIEDHKPVEEVIEENLANQTVPDQAPEEIVPIEPFHTVDYFASQGIKLSQEEQPKDKLGKQLKSFTEWLRTLKRMPAAEIVNEIDTPTERNVQHLAEDSVHEMDIVTEAMAEVWLKQGNNQKAMEVYKKLKERGKYTEDQYLKIVKHLQKDQGFSS
jgi:hypothetical protein